MGKALGDRSRRAGCVKRRRRAGKGVGHAFTHINIYCLASALVTDASLVWRTALSFWNNLRLDERRLAALSNRARAARLKYYLCNVYKCKSRCLCRIRSSNRVFAAVYGIFYREASCSIRWASRLLSCTANFHIALLAANGTGRFVLCEKDAEGLFLAWLWKLQTKNKSILFAPNVHPSVRCWCLSFVSFKKQWNSSISFRSPPWRKLKRQRFMTRSCAWRST